MNNNFLTYMTAAVVIGIILLLAINLAPFFQQTSIERYINFNDVRGVEIIHKGKPFTLNFDQQNSLITLLNRSIPIAKQEKKETLDFEKITIYRFNAHNIEVTPIAFSDKNLIFSVPAWEQGSLLKDISNGELQNLLSETYDP